MADKTYTQEELDSIVKEKAEASFKAGMSKSSETKELEALKKQVEKLTSENESLVKSNRESKITELLASLEKDEKKRNILRKLTDIDEKELDDIDKLKSSFEKTISENKEIFSPSQDTTYNPTRIRLSDEGEEESNNTDSKFDGVFEPLQ